MSDNPYAATNDPESPAPKKSRKMLYIILGVLGVTCLLCCCGSPMMLMWVGQGRLKTDPVEVTEKADEMLKMDRTEDLQPIMYMDLVFMKMTMWGAGKEDMTDMFCQMSMNESYAQDREAMKIQMEAKMREQAAQNPSLPVLNIDKSETRAFSVRGQPVEFDFNECTARETDEKYYQLTGIVDSKDGSEIVVLFLQLRAEKFSEERITQMLESIE